MFGWVALQSEIMAEPERFVEPDPELPLALLDQKEVCNNMNIWFSYNFSSTY